jgi:hypothetical protein
VANPPFFQSIFFGIHIPSILIGFLGEGMHPIRGKRNTISRFMAVVNLIQKMVHPAKRNGFSQDGGRKYQTINF